ncbi:MAG: hypothetical protein K6E85_16995 [Lachnospiraceae bacterium]|nr:hypothetical protein [Lachnospiraceae bacterium]
MSDDEPKIKGYHTFILPFTWEMPGVSHDKEYTALKAVFEKNSFWESTNLTNEDEILNRPDLKNDFDALRGFYKEYQYFFPYVRKSVYGGEDDICANYQLSASRNNGTYHILKGENHYVLNINAIRIRLVNTGIGLFIMECENYGFDFDGKPQNDIDSIKNINEYGRRVTLPFIQEDLWITADKLYVDIPGIGKFEDDFKQFVTDTCKRKMDGADYISFRFTCNFIRELLSFNSSYRFTSHLSSQKNDIRIWPVLDDRMYVAFATCEKTFIEKVTELKDGDYCYKKDGELNNSIYEIAYTDNAGNCSCPDSKLRDELLEQALYNRWLPYGTLYTITAMEMGMISSADIGGSLDYLYENFITCYLQMVYITLIQRASIVKFNLETAEIARHFAANGKKLDRSGIRNIMNLQERHAAFDSQLLFSEVSPEQQAIEMYDKLKQVFALEEEDKKLDDKLTSLYEITDTDIGINVNIRVEILTKVSIILSLAALLYSILFTSSVALSEVSGFTGTSNEAMYLLIITLVLSIFFYIEVKIRNRRK